MLKYVGLTTTQEPFGQTLSGTITATIGAPYKLVFQQFVGNSFGGEPFQNNPVVGVADRGGNVLKSVNNGRIYANLTVNPTRALLRPFNHILTPIINGFGNFSNLYINEAAKGYQISFTTDIAVSS